jgi:uncharacterized membrane protein (DUF485 family)
MRNRTASEVLGSPEFLALVRRRWAVSVTLTASMLVVYFGFVLVLAFGKESLATRVGEHLTVGIPVGVGVILFAWILTGLYVWWANGRYDGAVASLKRQLGD